MQDSLGRRISDKKELSDAEIDAIIKIIGERCREKTKNMLYWALHAVPDIPNYGIYSRVLLNEHYELNGKDINIVATYCAGQSYPDEIRTVRQCLIGR